jgi:putative Mn2+ efflux pump MntP
MLGAVSAACLVVGALIAFVASDYPQQTRAMEISGGLLLISGLALLGLAFGQEFLG